MRHEALPTLPMAARVPKAKPVTRVRERGGGLLVAGFRLLIWATRNCR
jgi:hypothetical protein